MVAVLSDLFGIQARSGCFCAGPYIHRMYPIDDEWSEQMDAEVSAGHMGAKLAFTRLSFNYFITETVFEYIVAAVDMLATDGWKLLPLYRFDPETGLWHHRDSAPEPAPRLAEAFDAVTRPGATAPESVLTGQLRKARWIIDAAGARPPRGPLRDPAVSEAFERVRWFPLPGEGRAQVPAARR